ncbi:MAG: hypothetical protein KC478_03565 [Bacteriovoracaceae bacterium]|nr:hypothetical protein [Bacteriovoracaceae bacterium]
MRHLSIILCTFFFCNLAQAYVDLSLNYNFSKRKIEGVETSVDTDPGMAVTTTEGWSINWGWFIWEYTALELNYSRTSERLVDDRESSNADGSFTIKEIDSLVVTEVQGAGLRQSFASRKSLIIPSLSLGYAKLITSGETNYKVDDGSGEEDIPLERDRETSNSGYVAFSLRFRLTKLMGLSLSAKSVMPDFDTTKMEENLLYSAGFSWVF